MAFNRTDTDWRDPISPLHPPKMHFLNRAYAAVWDLFQNAPAAATFYMQRRVRRGQCPRVEFDLGATKVLAFLVSNFQLKNSRIESYGLKRPFRREEIAEACGVSERRVSRALKLFEDIGFTGSHQSRDKDGNGKVVSRWFTDTFWRVLSLVNGSLGLLRELKRIRGDDTGKPVPPKPAPSKAAAAAKATADYLSTLYDKGWDALGWPKPPDPCPT